MRIYIGTDDENNDYCDNDNGADDVHGMLELDWSLSGKDEVNCVGERCAEKSCWK